MKRAAAYTRYSSDNQRDESIDAQVRAIEAYCKQKGFNLVKIYADRAKSATSDKRPEFLQMNEDSEKGMFDILIVHKLDRFSRDKYDSAKYKRTLKKNGIQLRSVTENLDGSPESDNSVALNDLFAETN
jgi:site-specific DNA recombinase